MATFVYSTDFNNATFSTAKMSDDNNLSTTSSFNNDSDLYDNTSIYLDDYNNSNHYDYGYNEYGSYEYEEYVYVGYPFERPVYLYIWNILVILLFLVNVVVISVLMRRKMRTATNMILSAISISDTMTGLVTLPTYIMVYHNTQDPLQYEDDSHINSTNITQHYDTLVTQPSVDVYFLTKDLCRGFMLSKYFLSKMFHTVSIFLTLFLAVHRYASVAFPHNSQHIFSIRNTVIFCVIIFFVSPLLHLYHVATDKAVDGLCQWELREDGCGGDCIFLWILFIVRHFIPCVSLTIFTVLFIKHLRGGARNFQNADKNSPQTLKRRVENRRISTIVIGIVVVFLIPEIPYGVFLLYHAIDKATTNGDNSNLEVNRGIHMGYELLLVLSFNANFYIYTFLNRKFRKCLKRTYLYPLQRFVGDQKGLSISKSSSISTRATRKTDCGSSQGAMEMKSMQTSSSDKSVTMQTKLQ
ncbi:sex peptide receptor-like [Ruditapes philippinarum]|uniref:sex peptide receptor-like n=1 Tax=Ruditapes philippinarum TaxID=129788 RepID=UPI00295AC612|nr:sex peptide receptor-like [Ruditapes philippinarum]XP_060579360.1 sex peptide receptor-like [Ruditapes philippinarum]